MTAWRFSSTDTSAEQKFWRRETSKSRADSLCARISTPEVSSRSTDQIPDPTHLVTLLITKNDSKKWSLETTLLCIPQTYCSRILQCARPQCQILLDETYEPTTFDRSPWLSQIWQKCILVVMRLKCVLPLTRTTFAKEICCHSPKQSSSTQQHKSSIIRKSALKCKAENAPVWWYRCIYQYLVEQVQAGYKFI